MDRSRRKEKKKWMWGGWWGGWQFVLLIFNSVGQFGWSSYIKQARQSRAARAAEHIPSLSAQKGKQICVVKKKVAHECIISITALAPQRQFTWASFSPRWSCGMNLSATSCSSGGFDVKIHWLHMHASPQICQISHKGDGKWRECASATMNLKWWWIEFSGCGCLSPGIHV